MHSHDILSLLRENTSQLFSSHTLRVDCTCSSFNSLESKQCLSTETAIYPPFIPTISIFSILSLLCLRSLHDLLSNSKRIDPLHLPQCSGVVNSLLSNHTIHSSDFGPWSTVRSTDGMMLEALMMLLVIRCLLRPIRFCFLTLSASLSLPASYPRISKGGNLAYTKLRWES